VPQGQLRLVNGLFDIDNIDKKNLTTALYIENVILCLCWTNYVTVLVEIVDLTFTLFHDIKNRTYALPLVDLAFLDEISLESFQYFSFFSDFSLIVTCEQRWIWGP
jgi:hypothetical protein